MGELHQSDSSVQSSAESAIVEALGAQLQLNLVPGGTLKLAGGASIQLDARSDDGSVAVEAYARQGVLRGGQLKKIAQDILKLALLRAEPEHKDVRPIIVFASEEARSSVKGWLRQAADTFGVELHVVELDDALRAQIVAVQDRQKMTNVALPAVVGDLTVED
ncbi:hypothetical protein [Knoellia subterranea]|uniref:Uncharacterized protein n=1 Tax=Knoellia subterranea KCTC 19937 TaxID=1385521 RepID=A0A0A0JPT2_9MICO|nr:hypothetical protein [Knoellia subterranea]KGN37601.1 hypothetical protein N803_14195 [Knoellia subterranea KCTC 19937]